MHIEAIILRRLQDVEKRLAALGEPQRNHAAARIERHLAAIRRLMHAAVGAEPGGCAAHPLGDAPFRSAQILFHLDASEESLATPAAVTDAQAIAPERLLYPSAALSLARRAVAAVLCLRGWFRSEAVDYDVPTVREAAFLHSPRGLGHLLAWWLPRVARPSLAHPSRRPGVPVEAFREPGTDQRTSNGKAA